jgi:hypothetical protein
MGKRESPIEDYLKEQVALHGGLAEKHVSPGRNKVPDQLVTWHGIMDLVETKAPDGKPDEGQLRDHRRRALRGIRVHVLSTFEGVDEYIAGRKPYWP